MGLRHVITIISFEGCPRVLDQKLQSTSITNNESKILKQSIRNFKSITKRVREFIQNSGGKYILDRKLIDQICEYGEDEIEEELKEFELKLTSGNYPKL